MGVQEERLIADLSVETSRTSTTHHGVPSTSNSCVESDAYHGPPNILCSPMRIPGPRTVCVFRCVQRPPEQLA